MASKKNHKLFLLNYQWHLTVRYVLWIRRSYMHRGWERRNTCCESNIASLTWKCYTGMQKWWWFICTPNLPWRVWGQQQMIEGHAVSWAVSSGRQQWPLFLGIVISAFLRYLSHAEGSDYLWCNSRAWNANEITRASKGVKMMTNNEEIWWSVIWHMLPSTVEKQYHYSHNDVVSKVRIPCSLVGGYQVLPPSSGQATIWI
jgi:hypothetical protein